MIQAGKPLATSCPRGHRKNQDKSLLLCFSCFNKIKWLADYGLAKQSGLESQGVKIKNTALVSLGGARGWVMVGIDY